MRVWVTATIVGITSLQASLSLAADLPDAVTHSNFPSHSAEEVLLGRDLFYDPILSGNRNIACATCHHPKHGTSDGMSLSIGQGAAGLGPARKPLPGTAPDKRIPRNAPALWNLGAYEFTVMFHDGRTMWDDAAPYDIKMPQGRDLEGALPSALAAQVILPMLSPEEMAGRPSENPVARAVADEKIAGAEGAWSQLTARVAAISEYQTRFAWLKGDDTPLHINDIAKALAAFISTEFRATSSPFDAYLNGDDTALSAEQKRGMDLFYGKAQCSSCHSGPFQTDQSFHAIGIPQLGPGKDPEGATAADRGREYVTNDPEDRYRFRTPSLRNVTLTAPYGHSGAYATLEQVVRHHLDPIPSLMAYDRAQAKLARVAGLGDDWTALNTTEELVNIAEAIELPPLPISDSELADLLAFLGALTDPAAANGRLGVPQSVPSGLPVDR